MKLFYNIIIVFRCLFEGKPKINCKVGRYAVYLRRENPVICRLAAAKPPLNFTTSPMKTERLRGRKWQTIRSRVLTANPLCVLCQAKGQIEPALEVDHIEALTNGGSNDAENLQGLCLECHANKTRADLGQAERAQFDANGRAIW
jgi:5-methylcytosine-specific restriction endonuclease McrA